MMRIDFLPLVFLSALASCSCGDHCPASPRDVGIQIVTAARQGVGGPDEMDTISGSISGADSNDVKVLLYAHAGDRWWVQPYEDAPFTVVGSDRQWTARIHLGYEYAAFLVHRSYASPPKQPMSLPEVHGCIWAVTVKPGRT
jgi:hypothetical protein